MHVKARHKKSLFFLLILLSISLSGCFQWAARAKNKLPNQTALNQTYSYKGKVLIIGAGAAGLAAAKVLEQNNIDYVILEASNCFGGRLKKDSTLADFPIDMGAEWIHSHPNALNVLKGKKATAKIHEELIPYHLDSALKWDNKRLKGVKKSYLDFYYNFISESKFKRSTWYDFVKVNLAQNVDHKIIYNTNVQEINYEEDQVIVKTESGIVYNADRVLVTVSIGVLKSNHISFIPKINRKKQKAVDAITFRKGFKVALKFSKKFYPDVIQCKAKNGERTFYDIAFKKEAKTHVLGFLCVGSEVSRYSALPTEKDVIVELIRELDNMFNGQASRYYTGEYAYENWGENQFIQGTWTQAFQEKRRHLKQLNKSLEQRVYFAGEINDPYKQMGVPGAILSGYSAIHQLLTDKN